MEINLNKEDITETSEFVNFSIREYVAEIRKKDRKKCWPFGSLGDPDIDEDFSPYQSAESTFLSSQNCPGDIYGSDDTPEHTEGPNYMIESPGINDNLEKTVCNGSSDSTSNEVNNTECRNEISVTEGATTGSSVATDNGEPENNRARKRPQKFRLLSDIYKELEGPVEPLLRCDVTNPDNVNGRFATETEDELDDNVTLDVIFRKLKGVEVTPALKKKKKRSIRHIQDKKSKHGSKSSHSNDLDVGLPRIPSRKTRIEDTQTMAKNVFRMQKKRKINMETETADEDSEMEAVMLLARHFNEEKQKPSTNDRILRELETEKGCAGVQKKIREQFNESISTLHTKTSSKTTTNDPVFHGDTSKKFPKENLENNLCLVNKNPADFSIPNAENEFMRGG